MSATENKEPAIGSVFERILAQAQEKPNFIEIEVRVGTDVEKIKVKKLKDAFEINRLDREAKNWIKQTSKRILLPGMEELKALWPIDMEDEDRELLKGAFLIQHLLEPEPTEVEVLKLLREANETFTELVFQIQAAMSYTAEINEREELEATKND